MTAKRTKTKVPRYHARQDFMSILGEMDSPNNRAASIVAAAFIENNLALAIMARFRDLKDRDQNEFFENRGVLSDFANKIDVGFALGIYGPLVRADLDNIRRICNQFAHHLEVRDFDHVEVAAMCDGLNAPKFLDLVASPTPPKQRTRKDMYLDTADHLAARFDLELKKALRPPSGVALITPDY